ncbi:Uma2 family endonuclease [Sphingosinicella sp. LY1275]|uniref:Uma2 family endonuclease n=1 Tax=Sphingosinicella sp. LY1275 TaxID=3095379 RepID=UPI002ADEE6F4|nr:Uma2 family endonuclease [Sphingosinicella sp. LY1275]MEA1014062.1 Uma2 family endonuclease [Sphingosinicella sp. LY1275]
MTVIEPINVPQPVKLTIEQFELLDRSGAFDGYAKTELIEGAIYAMQGQHRPHAFVKTELAYRLRVALEAMGSALVPLIEGTVGMPPFSAPEPDIAVTSAPKGEGYIPLDSVALAVEVSDSSAAFDLKDKLALYARHRVPEYWVVEIPAVTLHQFWLPSETGYADHRSIPIGERAESITIPGLFVATDGLI